MAPLTQALVKESRSGHTNPDGKCDRRLDLLVTEELESAIIAMAALKGISKSEYVRSMLERVMFGEFPMMQKIASKHD